jgi:hypothetical protein
MCKFIKSKKVAWGFFRMNSKYLNEPKAIARMLRIWRGQREFAPFFSKLRNVIKFYMVFCIRKAKENKHKEKGVQRSLEIAQEQVQQDPHNEVTKEMLQRVIEESEKTEERRLAN